MRTFHIMLLLLLVLFSCERKKEITSKSQIIKNEDLTTILKKFIQNSPIQPSYPENNILVFLHVEQEDTVLDLLDQPVLDCENFIGTIPYQNRILFLFTTSNLKNKLENLIEPSTINSNINCAEKVDTSDIYLSYQESYILRNGLLKQR